MWRQAVVGVLLVVPGVAVGQVSITFEDARVVARGVTPGGSSVWFSAAHEQPNVHVRLVSWTKVLADGDRDGVVAFPLDGPVPLSSVWAVVDLATGLATAGAPDGMPFRERPFPHGAIRGERPGLADHLAFPQARARVLLVRPGVGAWVGEAADATLSDTDGAGDGAVELALTQLAGLDSTTPPPGLLEPRDRIVALNPDTLEITLTTYEGER